MKRLSKVVGTALFCALAANQAYAQNADDGSSYFEEIVVTAQKREQRLEEVPIAMQAFSSELMKSTNMRDFFEVISMVPGANEDQSQSPTRRRYSVRGIVQAGANPDTTIGYYFNESPYFIFGRPAAPITRTFDMERVEVLRGPQSTLYGNSAMGGVVRFITKKPNLENFEAHFQTAYTDMDGGESGHFVDGALSIPLIEDQLGIRVVASQEGLGGYHMDSLGNDDVNPTDINSYRTELLWRANDDLTFNLLYLNEEGESDYSQFVSSLDPPINNQFPGDFYDNDQEMLSATMNWDLNFATLTVNVTSIDSDEATQLSALLPGLGLPNDLISLTNAQQGEALNGEVRLASQGDGPLQWLAGVFYSDTENDSDTLFSALLPSGASRSESKAVSVFGEVSYSLLDGKLIPLVGVRWFDDDRERFDSNLVTQVPAENFDAVSPRFNLQWLPGENANYYLNIVKGFRSGNFVDPNICGLIQAFFGFPCRVAIDSDEVWSYEVGAKWTLLDGQMQLDASVYYMDWTDNRQAVQFAPGLTADIEVGDAEYTGLDLSLIYAPASVAGLVLQASANINDNKFAGMDPTVSAVSGVENGDRVSLTSENTFALAADYEWSLYGNWRGKAAMTFTHVSAAESQFGSIPDADARDMLRARIGANNGSIGLYLFGTNLLNEDGAIFIQDIAGSVNAMRNPPRLLGIEFTYDLEGQ